MKSFLKKILPHLSYFYVHLRYRLLILLGVNIGVGLLDGLGLAMFLPLLEIVANQGTEATSAQMGKLSFLVEALQGMGLNLTLSVVLLTMLVFFCMKGLAVFIGSYLNVVYQQYFIRKIRVENIEALSHYSYQAFVGADAGAIQNTLSGEVGRVVQAYRSYNSMLQQGVLILTYAGLAFLANPEFAILVLVAGVLSNFLFNTLYRKTKQLSQKFVKSSHEFQGLLIQKVAFFKYLKATGAIRRYGEALKERVYEIEDATRKMGVLSSILMGIREPLLMAIVVATILVQVKVFGGSLTTIILSLLFFYRALGSVTALQTNYNNFLSFSGSLTNMTNFLEDLQLHKERRGGRAYQPLQREVRLENLSFGYRKEVPFLQNLSFRLRRNETLALVGESGSGKTTLMNILSGLLQPDSGEIWLDSQRLSELNTTSFQRRIGYITQEPVVFDDTVFNNVTFWADKTPVNLQRFWEALEKASIRSFIEEQPDRENTRLGNNGINLSGGQKQRISIARELYKEVDFLFMDEATSALDSETERAIQEKIEELHGQYTIVIIAHRLSTIKNADRIVVMKKGRIDQIDNYEGLVEKSKVFRRLSSLQKI